FCASRGRHARLVSDWSSAVCSPDLSDQTQRGWAVGTPAYMSPEQAAGRWDVIGPASDVYNLGAVLYTLLTGRPPLEGNNWPELRSEERRVGKEGRTGGSREYA